jgi:hypothetical protein
MFNDPHAWRGARRSLWNSVPGKSYGMLHARWRLRTALSGAQGDYIAQPSGIFPAFLRY